MAPREPHSSFKCFDRAVARTRGTIPHSPPQVEDPRREGRKYEVVDGGRIRYEPLCSV